MSDYTAPEEIFLEITHACPMSCVHCSSFRERERRFDRNAYMSVDRIKATLRSFAGCGGAKVVFSGGEPLLHPDLLPLIEYATSLGLAVRLFSSGLVGLLSREVRSINLDSATQLKRVGLSKIEFNLQGATRATHERITRTRGSFERVIESISNSRTAGLAVGVHFVPMRENYREFERLVTLARDMRVDSISVLRFVPQGRGEFYRDRLEMTAREFFEFGAELARIRKECVDTEIRTGCPMNLVTIHEQEREPVKCGAAKTTAVILADGKVVPCAAFKQAEQFVAGSILDQEFEKIWAQAPVFEELRRFDHSKSGGGCEQCSKLAESEGLCHAQRYAASGSIYHGHDPHCASGLIQITRAGSL